MLYINNPYNSSSYKENCSFCPTDYDYRTMYVNSLPFDALRVSNENPYGSVVLGEQNLKPNNFKISYPFIPNPENDPAKMRINDAITGEVAELIKTQVLRPEEIDFVDITGAYEVMLNQDGLLSILLELYTYVNHAAHGFTQYSSLTADVKTGTIYSFQDLFNGSINYVRYLNQLAKQYIEDNDIVLINEYNGITPGQKFYLTPDSLVLYYQVYEYTPYAYGLFKIPIPYSKIVNLLSPTSPIRKLLPKR